jgi:hypothetical protein
MGWLCYIKVCEPGNEECNYYIAEGADISVARLQSSVAWLLKEFLQLSFIYFFFKHDPVWDLIPVCNQAAHFAS